MTGQILNMAGQILDMTGQICVTPIIFRGHILALETRLIFELL